MSTLTCDQCRAQLSPYLDRELASATRTAVDVHLEACPCCHKRFAAEKRVEDIIRTRLSEPRMSEELWQTLRADVLEHPRTLRFPVGRILAVAASVVLVAAAGLFYSMSRRPDRGQDGPSQVARVSLSVADLLQQATPQFAAFTDPPQANFAARLSALSRKYCGAEVVIDPGHADGHPLELVDVRERRDAKGVTYLEVHLNCCGKPVVLAMAKQGSPSGIDELCTPTPESQIRRGDPRGSGDDAASTRTIKVNSFERDGVIIAGATADHSFDGVWAAIRVNPT